MILLCLENLAIRSGEKISTKSAYLDKIAIKALSIFNNAIWALQKR